MPKFFVPRENISENNIIITGEDVQHIKRVLRMRVGEELMLCDSCGMDYRAEIAEIYDDEISCDILEKVQSDTEPNIAVTLFQGLPKSSKMDYIIQKTTELGITKIVPCALARCVSKPEGDKKTARWQKIAESAAKQSGRGAIPQVTNAVKLDEAVKELQGCDLAFVPYECEEMRSIKSILTSKPDVKTVGFVIGPEGGFDKSEIDKLEAAGVTPVSLGKRILRTETAGEAVLTMIMYEIGDINN